jgi:DNA-binding NtrC family response regulator
VRAEPGPDALRTRELLETSGFGVRVACSFDEAKRMIAEDPPDVLVTDLRLGAYNGLHLVLRTRVDHPRLASVVVSPFADAALANEAARQNAVFLVRPLAAQDLLDVVRRTLR